MISTILAYLLTIGFGLISVCGIITVSRRRDMTGLDLFLIVVFALLALISATIGGI